MRLQEAASFSGRNVFKSSCHSRLQKCNVCSCVSRRARVNAIATAHMRSRLNNRESFARSVPAANELSNAQGHLAPHLRLHW